MERLTQKEVVEIIKKLINCPKEQYACIIITARRKRDANDN